MNTRKKLFGTDGVRAIANTGSITPEICMKLGMAAGTVFKNAHHQHDRPLVVIGKDTRVSGYLVESAITSGLIAVGMDVLLVGPMPTPSVSMLTKSLRADLGIMISASHNPFPYNGIKIFNSQGTKLDDATEQKIEDLVFGYPDSIKFVAPEHLGKAVRLNDAPGRYIEFAKNTFPKGKNLHGLKIVVDSANGAAYHISEKIFWELGAEVIHIGNAPDGYNINKDCGAMSCALAQKTVVENKANLGIVLDGDADRLMIIDENGEIINGDKILATIALHMKKNNKLVNNTVVATQMSNMSLELFLKKHDIKLIRTDVGDKYVARIMHDKGYNLGGEQSGHIIISDCSFTGDGIIAGLQVLASLIENGSKSISELCNKYTEFPQTIINLKYKKDASEVLDKPAFKELISETEKELNGNGRISVRKSGTEPLIRVMIEAQSTEFIENFAEALSKI